MRQFNVQQQSVAYIFEQKDFNWFTKKGYSYENEHIMCVRVYVLKYIKAYNIEYEISLHDKLHRTLFLKYE